MRAIATIPSGSAPFASTADRARLSAPALRGFLGIAERWALDEDTQLALLGHPARSTFYAWKKSVLGGGRPAKVRGRAAAVASRGLVLPADTLARIAHMVDIYSSIEEWLGGAPAEADGWVHASNTDPPFFGVPPILYMVEGGLPALANVGGYLRSVMGGPR